MTIVLLTIDEVAALLHCSPRTVKRRGIAYVRDGNRRLYSPADVQAYLERQRQCPSSDAPTRRIGIRRSKSKGHGLFEALAQRIDARR